MFEVDDRLGGRAGSPAPGGRRAGDRSDPYRPGRSRPARWGEPFPPERGSDERLAEQLQLLRRRRAQDEASEAQLVVELASRRPSAADSGAQRPAAADPDEFFCDELALIWNCSPTAAAVDHEPARTLMERLPRTWAAMADGQLDRARGRAIAAELGAPADGTDPAVIAQVEAAVLPRAAELSLRRLRELVRRELVARDAEAAERRRRLARDAVDVKVRGTGDGMAQVVSGHTGPTAAAIRDAVDPLAWLRKKEDGDPRPIGVLRAEVLADLVLRRLALPDGPGRHPARHHPVGRHPHQPPAGALTPGPRPGRPAALLAPRRQHSSVIGRGSLSLEAPSGRPAGAP